MRTSATRAEVQPLLDLVKVDLREPDWPCLLDPRGTRFQRLEWLGDSVLDALLALHVHGGTACSPREDYAALCSDVALGRRAQAVGLAEVLDWPPSPQRLADVVEALIGAAWLVGPDAAATCASILVHDHLGTGPVATVNNARKDARLGAAVLEAASALTLFRRPELLAADEGELSRHRAHQIAGYHLVSQAAALSWPAGHGPTEDRLNIVQARVGAQTASAGLEPGLALASELLDA